MGSNIMSLRPARTAFGSGTQARGDSYDTNSHARAFALVDWRAAMAIPKRLSAGIEMKFDGNNDLWY
jgi:hypothetical protein